MGVERQEAVGRSVAGWMTGAFAVAGLALAFYLGDPRAHPGAAAALVLGLVLWFVLEVGGLDLPFGLTLGGAMGMIDWPDGPRAWLGIGALLLLCLARLAQRQLAPPSH
jgi:hypothetical protein